MYGIFKTKNALVIQVFDVLLDFSSIHCATGMNEFLSSSIQGGGVWEKTPDSTLWGEKTGRETREKRGGEKMGREQEEEGRKMEDGKAQKKVS